MHLTGDGSVKAVTVKTTDGCFAAKFKIFLLSIQALDNNQENKSL